MLKDAMVSDMGISKGIMCCKFGLVENDGGWKNIISFGEEVALLQRESLNFVDALGMRLEMAAYCRISQVVCMSTDGI